VREFLSARDVPFVERNIRKEPLAKKEVEALVGEVVVPVVVMGDRHVVGYDPSGLEMMLAGSERKERAQPPRDSLKAEQASMAARKRGTLAGGVGDLLARVREELAYSAAKGTGPYRQGMEDGLRFTEDALVAILQAHGDGSNDDA